MSNVHNGRWRENDCDIKRQTDRQIGINKTGNVRINVTLRRVRITIATVEKQ